MHTELVNVSDGSNSLRQWVPVLEWKRLNFFGHILSLWNEVPQGHYVPQNGDDNDSWMQTPVCTCQQGRLVLGDSSIKHPRDSSRVPKRRIGDTECPPQTMYVASLVHTWWH